MIKTLQIKNYALIERLEMTPSAGLNIITGETGAGKSIILGAVGLLLGNRVDTKVLLNEEEKCVIEGTFDISRYALRPLFEEEDLDYDQECVIRREISPAGKSRAFVNDTPANLQALRRIGEKLMDVHSQYESLHLGDNKYQLDVLDAFAGHNELKSTYQGLFQVFTQAKKKHQGLVDTASRNAEDTSYKQFLLDELVPANLDELDQQELEKELHTLEHAEDIKLRLSQAAHILDGSETAVLLQLKEVWQSFSSIRSFSDQLEELGNRMESSSIELQDIFSEVQRVQDKIEHDPERISQVKERLDVLYGLQKKHHVMTVGELITIRDGLADELEHIASLDGQLAAAEKVLAEAEKHMLEGGAKLTESRRLFALNFADEIEKMIRQMGIENGIVEVDVGPAEPNKDGLDTINILFSANKGIKPQELKEVASGGEFSRFIFAIKYLIADKTALPTIIFDEIDTGVSGQIALQMIRMMKEMAQNHQVISISHLPQFAAGGDAHYFVYKDHSADRSVSRIRRLENEDRIIEIAKMIGGEDPAPSAVESARELLQIG